MKPGTIVRMSDEFKRAMNGVGCPDHIMEFGECEGVVEGLTDYGNTEGPEVDVRWPSGLRYSYNPLDLVVVGEKKHRSIDDSDKTVLPNLFLKSRLYLRARLRLSKP